jgi:probable DNA metabolism protein
MHTVIYDGSFAGFISAVFDTYEYKMGDVRISPADLPTCNLFGQIHHATPDKKKVKRVWSGLEKYSSLQGLRDIHAAFYAGTPGIEDLLLTYMRYQFTTKKPIDRDYTNPIVLNVSQTAKKVRREKHRMEAFVRFQLTKDNLFYSIIQPDFNVLPLISSHFEKRYADQRWLIYDSLRKYGIYYDLNTVEEVKMDFNNNTSNGSVIRSIQDEKEELYQTLWKKYFDSVNIKARRNMKLHIQHMPKRYWRFLVEKQGNF